MDYTSQYLEEAIEILRRLDRDRIEAILTILLEARQRGGRIFFLGVGGGAGHASHAVNDFRKIADIECYAPTDNVSELTARINDDGWESSYRNWLRGSRLQERDVVFVFSVGGGDAARNISANLVSALKYARQLGAKICAVVGRDGGFSAQVSHACLLIPVVNPETITPHTESFQALIWHLLVSHPKLRVAEMKWESVMPVPSPGR
jgi:D-sedoheptulose 7-phosphate isomerase